MRRLGRHRSTINREIERNRRVVGGYRPESADDAEIAPIAAQAQRNAANVPRMRDPRFADSSGEVASFLPVEIVRAPALAATPSPGEGQIEIDLAGGHRLRITGGNDPETLARLLRGLRA